MIVAAVSCFVCGSTIFSRARHDFRWCLCKTIGIDGGQEYTKLAWYNPLEIFDVPDKPPFTFDLEIKQTPKELYDDWNSCENKYGLILPEKEKT